MSADPAVARAVEILLAGGLVGLPTETVYGLACDASNPEAVRRMFAAKGRPADHPVIVHLAQADAIDDWAVDVPESARRLAGAFWPGPLTLILRRASHVLDAVTGGQDTVGLRVPSHPMAHAVLQAFAQARGGRPAGLAAPSANKFGRVSPTTPEHVRREFGDALELVLDGGPSVVGIESTIVDCSGGTVRVLRPGHITRADVEAALDVRLAESPSATKSAPRHSGGLEAHYAPRTRTLLVDAADLADLLNRDPGARVALLSFASAPRAVVRHVQAPAGAGDYARALYANLRDLDDAACDFIVVERPPAGVEWEGVNDRLRRAATGSGHA